MHSIIRHGKAASSDKNTADEFLRVQFAYRRGRICLSTSVQQRWDWTLLEEKMPRRMYSTAKEKIPSHKSMKDRLTLIFCANSNSDLKIKLLLVYYSENPRAHKIQKMQLQVMRRDDRRPGSQGIFLENGSTIFSTLKSTRSSQRTVLLWRIYSSSIMPLDTLQTSTMNTWKILNLLNFLPATEHNPYFTANGPASDFQV